MFKSYVASMKEQTVQVLEELVELSEIVNNGHELTKYEYRAAERLLQLYVEFCIGIAKHSIKKANKSVPSQASSSFEKISDLNLFDIGELDGWYKIVGLRNVLVHDYLNIDRRIIRSVLEKRYFDQLTEFIDNGLTYLGKE